MKIKQSIPNEYNLWRIKYLPEAYNNLKEFMNYIITH